MTNHQLPIPPFCASMPNSPPSPSTSVSASNPLANPSLKPTSPTFSWSVIFNPPRHLVISSYRHLELSNYCARFAITLDVSKSRTLEVSNNYLLRQLFRRQHEKGAPRRQDLRLSHPMPLRGTPPKNKPIEL